MSWDTIARLRALVDDEIGTIRKEAPFRVALVYPSPYHVAMSSLGYQAMYRGLNLIDGVACDRAMLPDRDAHEGPLLTLERERPIAEYPIIAFSVAYELELPGLFACLERAGLPVLREDRDDGAPLILAGGPLTFSNPVPLAPFCDVIVMGEGEELGPEVVRRTRAAVAKDTLLGELAALPGVYVPAIHGDTPPPVAQIADAGLPAVSQILTPHTELSSMFLVEAGRGCSRGCTYCVMRRSTNGGMRAAPPERVLGAIPAAARRVGLVGAAVTDHPKIAEIVRAIVDGGREVGISSLRADRLTDELCGLLRRGGYRTLTVASDGSSERMRALIERQTYERHLLRAAELATQHGYGVLKVYMMVGIPGETDDDIDELIRFTAALGAVHRRVALGVAPFVAKRNTPLDGTPFAGIPVVEARLDRLRRGLAGRAVVRPTSARWAWVEYMLAQGDSRAGLAALDAWRAGGSFAAWKRAFAARDAVPTGPRARVPTTAELLAIKRRSVSVTPQRAVDASANT
jgi:radical SAM superfamily enzyme YgiQ (UPF0313 family)